MSLERKKQLLSPVEYSQLQKATRWGWISNHNWQTLQKTWQKTARRLAIRLPSQLTKTSGHHDHPLARQFIPQADELLLSPEELKDPIGDQDHSPVLGIVHRYPDRVLFMPTPICAVYCRFCFRHEKVGPKPDRPTQSLSLPQLRHALDYIRQDSRIWEVILSGGDPLMLPHKLFSFCLSELEGISHVKVLRIHTRVPLMAPQRISPLLLKNLSRKKPIYLVIHCNHPTEFTPQGRLACLKIAQTGTPMLAQSVLLKGVNDHAQTLLTLWRTLVENRIKPYYLHHPDLATGTKHFRVPIKKGQLLWQQIRQKASGICIPQYMLDLPSGDGKSPIAPPHIRIHKQGWQVLNQHGTWQIYSEDHS